MLNDPTIFPMLIGLGVIVLIGGMGLVFSRPSEAKAEERLAGLTGQGRRPKKADLSSGILARPAAIDLGQSSAWNRLIPNAENLNLLYEQADVDLEFHHFMAIVGGLALAGLVVGIVFHLPFYAIPVGSVFLAAMPFFWLLMRRKKRINRSSPRCPTPSS